MFDTPVGGKPIIKDGCVNSTVYDREVFLESFDDEHLSTSRIACEAGYHSRCLTIGNRKMSVSSVDEFGPACTNFVDVEVCGTKNGDTALTYSCCG